MQNEGEETLYTHDPVETNIPKELRSLRRWIYVRGSLKDGKRTKLPCKKNLKNCSAHNPINWGTYALDRVGLVMSGEDDVVTVDGDGVGDPSYQDLYDTIFSFFEGCTYVEGSISNVLEGKDKWHAIVRADFPEKIIKCPKLGIEIFPSGQFILTTGEKTSDYTVSKQNKAMERLLTLIRSINEGEKAKVSQQEFKPATRVTDDDHRESMLIIAWFRKNNVPICPDNPSFVRVTYCLKGCGWSNDEIKKLMDEDKAKHYPTMNTDDAMKRIESFKPKTRQIANLAAYAKQEGFNGAALRHLDVKPEEITVEYEKIEVVTKQEVKIKEQLTSRLPARGDSVGISGRSGSGKTAHAMDMIRECQNKELFNVLIVADMEDWQVVEREQEHGLDENELGKIYIKKLRHIHIDELVESIKTKAEGKTLGVVCLDNLSLIGRRLWRSVRREEDPKKFSLKDDDCADRFMVAVVDRIAHKLDCVVMIIAHPPKNASGRDKFPGSEIWTALFGIAYRIYRINATNVDEIPKAIIERFRREKRKTKEWTLAAIFKPRYRNATDYWLKIKGGIEREECVEQDVDLEELDNQQQRKKKPSPPKVDPAEYLQQVRAFLVNHPADYYGYKKLKEEMPDHPAISYEHWVGLIERSTVAIAALNSQTARQVYNDPYNGKPRLWYPAPKGIDYHLQ